MKRVYFGFLLVIGCVHAADMGVFEDTPERFLESFVPYYDVSTLGRYTHEYHPFLFEKSSKSLDGLEHKIVQEGFTIKGRIVLTGYEEQAIPSYYTHYKTCCGVKINDEVREKRASGWSEQLHNKFGVMTGFLFRDVPVINQVHQQEKKELLFEHINLPGMLIFNLESYVFQRHAFGQMLPYMQNEEIALGQKMLARDEKGVFAELINFWKWLYEYELRYGNRKVLGTQDVLFSIAYAEHLYRSKIPLLKYYVGPDITYPIKVTKLQKQAATYNAQIFVKKFVEQLKPVNNEATVYVFCSFVDGVGKSTLLGNIQNYQKYGLNFAKYDPVDNSSSQFAVLYPFSDKVFIADLPAQMSHFTYKPDGMVYFDIFAAGSPDNEISNVLDCVKKNKVQFVQEYQWLLQQVKETVQRQGFFAPSLQNPEQPERAFIKNVLLLKRERENRWIPFSYQGKHYLFDKSNPAQCRQLVRLELADSIGLKNYDADQMLFFDGVRFPFPYEVFLTDLVDKFKKANIKNVVMVNFLSMYPRSSRENIRVNYLLQQLSLLYDEFSLGHSMYGFFVNDAHLLYKLKTDQDAKFLRALQKEALVRLSLYNVMQHNDVRTVKGIAISRVTELLKQQLEQFPQTVFQHAAQLAQTKIDNEKVVLEQVHGRSKNFINVQELDFNEVLALSEKLHDVCLKYVNKASQVKTTPALERLKFLWKEPGEVLGSFSEIEGEVNDKIKLSDGSWAHLLYVVSANCKDEALLTPIVRQIRLSWYAALLNVMSGTERMYVPFIWVKPTQDGKVAIFRREFDALKKPLTTEVERSLISDFNIIRPFNMRWGLYKEKPYFLSSELAQTDRKLFAFGCDQSDFEDRWPGLDLQISWLIYNKKHKSHQNSEDIMFTSQLWQELCSKYTWRHGCSEAREQAKENSKKLAEQKKSDKKKEEQGDASLDQANVNDDKKEQVAPKRNPQADLRLATVEQVELGRFVVRALATLEMVIKDPCGEIAVRRNNREDFEAALKLVEKVVFPTYFTLLFEKDLFSDYHAVQPIFASGIK